MRPPILLGTETLAEAPWFFSTMVLLVTVAQLALLAVVLAMAAAPIVIALRLARRRKGPHQTLRTVTHVPAQPARPSALTGRRPR